MHRSILGAALAAAAATTVGAAQAQPAPASACPRAGAPVLERFISADCPACWAAEDIAAPPAGGWLFDWITPTPAGSEAPLAAAAVPEAAERAQRGGGPAPAGAHVLVLRTLASAAGPAAPGLHMTVQSGPAWNGYFGLRLDVRGRVPAGSSAWLALVELLPAGSEGSAAERQLVRSVAGPLPLQGLHPARTLGHLRALRWPDGAQPTRLQARAWIEAPDGALLGVASDRCALR